MYAWVPSGGQENSSLSSERGGLLGGMAAISYILMVELSVTPGKRISLSVYVDSLALISRIKRLKYGGPSGTLRTTDYDILQLSMHRAEELVNIDLIPHHDAY